MTPSSNSKPNIVFLFADEWRAQACGYAGDPNVETPFLDKLAKRSVNFTNAVSGCPVCCPYRGSLLTGQYPFTHGIVINDVPIQETCNSIARAFNQSGYNTAYIGKWHVYGSPEGQNERRRDPVTRSHQLGFDYWKGFECNHNYNKSPYYFNDDPNQQYWEGYDAFSQTEDACSYIKNQVGKKNTEALGFESIHLESFKPFLLMVSYGPPHFPLHSAPEEFRSLYATKEIHLRENVPESHREKAIEELRGYYAHISALDACFEKVYQTLETSGQLENTIFVITSDHGDMMESQGLHHKWLPFDESIRIPFLLHYPNLGDAAVSTLNVPIDAPDIMPTLLGLCCAAVPSSVEGQDYSGLIRGDSKETERECAFLNVLAETTTLQYFGFPAYRGVRSNRYTYIHTCDGPFMLFDNETDPYQKNNLINKPELKEIQSWLDSEMHKYLDKTKDLFLPGKELLKKKALSHYKEANWECKELWKSPWT